MTDDLLIGLNALEEMVRNVAPQMTLFGRLYSKEELEIYKCYDKDKVFQGIAIRIKPPMQTILIPQLQVISPPAPVLPVIQDTGTQPPPPTAVVISAIPTPEKKP